MTTTQIIFGTILGIGLLSFLLYIYERTKYHLNVRKKQSNSVAPNNRLRVSSFEVNVDDVFGRN
jgi:hypothetical protein